MIDPLHAGGDHRPRDRLAQQEHGLQVDAKHAIEVLFLELEEFAGMQDAGIVDQDVDALVAREHVAHDAPHVVGVRDVGSDERRVAPGAAAAALPASSIKSTSVTCAPSAVKRSAIAKPIPRAAPVTSA